jgi:hypothetical protein
VKRQRLNCGGISKWGKGPYSDSQLGGKPGDLRAKRMKAKAQTGRVDAAVLSRNRCTERIFPGHGICALFYIPARHTVQWNTRRDELRCSNTRAGLSCIPACAQCSCRPVAPESESGREPHHQADGQQEQCAPAQPQQRSTQMRGGGERHTQATADREIGGYAHGTLRHQRKGNTGQSPCGGATRSPRSLPLPRWLNGRGSIPPARANQTRIVRSCHACASSWQHEDAAGWCSY